MGEACGTVRRQEGCIHGLGGDLRGRDHLEHLVIDGRIILKLILRWDGRSWTGLIWLLIGTGSSSCEYGIEPSRSKTFGEFLDYLWARWLLKKLVSCLRPSNIVCCFYVVNCSLTAKENVYSFV